MGHKAKDQTQRKFVLMMTWEVIGLEVLAIFSLAGFNGHVEKFVESCESVHGGNGFGNRNLEGRTLLEICDEKELCLTNTWFQKEEQRIITCCAGRYKTAIDLVLVGK